MVSKAEDTQRNILPLSAQVCLEPQSIWRWEGRFSDRLRLAPVHSTRSGCMHLLSTYYVPLPGPDVGNTAVNKTDKNPCPCRTDLLEKTDNSHSYLSVTNKNKDDGEE